MIAGGQVWFLRCVGNCFGLRNQQRNAVARTTNLDGIAGAKPSIRTLD